MAKKNQADGSAVADNSTCTIKGTEASKHLKAGKEYKNVPGKTANHLIKNGHAELIEETKHIGPVKKKKADVAE